jgi:2-(1,2-epoxy-1,2-dihydrophenyl)acetyl-CoA isomerase
MGNRRELDTGSKYLLGWVEDGVAVLSFNQPDRRNALRDEMYVGFDRALPVVAADPAIGCLVVTGEGGAFCAGGDVKAFHEAHLAGRPAGIEGTAEARIEDVRRRQRVTTLALHQLPKLTIAAIPGPVAGAGVSFALACDLRIATESAILVTAFSTIGTSGDFGASWFLTQLVGPSKAKELTVLSPRLSARDAERLGLVNQVVDDAAFAGEWMALARRVASGPTLAHRAIKENINRAVVADLATALDGEATNMVATMASEDHQEAVAAFLEKRSPRFQGR